MKTTDFRKFHGDSRVSLNNMLDMSTSPFILIKKNGESTYANSRGDKQYLIEQFNEKKDLLLFAWSGRWRTDVFQLSKEDLI